MAESHQTHTLQLTERKQLTMSAVTEVVSFDDSTVVLHTALGTLIIQGQELQLKTLSREGGKVVVDGNISAMIYEEPRSSWRRRLLG